MTSYNQTKHSNEKKKLKLYSVRSSALYNSSQWPAFGCERKAAFSFMFFIFLFTASPLSLAHSLASARNRRDTARSDRLIRHVTAKAKRDMGARQAGDGPVTRAGGGEKAKRNVSR